MSVNFNRAGQKWITDRRTYNIKVIYDDDPYWDEGLHLWPNWNTRYEDNWKRRKQLFSYQMRMYKTWKHNRKTQWKN